MVKYEQPSFQLKILWAYYLGQRMTTITESDEKKEFEHDLKGGVSEWQTYDWNKRGF